jgi:hypothetical protein
MYKKEFPPILESVEDLEARLKYVRDARLHSRLRLLILIRSGQVTTRVQAAELLPAHRNSVGKWLRTYERDGLGQLLIIGVPKPPSEQKSLPTSVFKALSARVEADGFSSYVAAQQWLREAHGLTVPYRTVHGLVRYRLGSKLKRARPRHKKKRQ